jgi:glutathione S-transferase
VILIGQFDSPFVRRTAIALRLYDLPFEHRAWSVWADADALGKINPLRRVPTLVLESGITLIESGAILDYLDELVGPERAMIPRSGSGRRVALNLCALATGLADKAVSLFYETLLHQPPSQTWIDRCRSQITDVLTWLEACRVGVTAPYWQGPAIGHADVATACALRFTREAHPGLFDPARYPELAAFADRCEALEAFQAICQPIRVSMPGDA